MHTSLDIAQMHKHVANVVHIPSDGFKLCNWLIASGSNVQRNIVICQQKAKKKTAT